MSDVLSDGLETVVTGFKTGALNLDSFGRLRTSQPTIEFEFNAFNDILFSNVRNYFAKTEASGATVSYSGSTKSYVVASGTTNGASAVAQQKAYNKYQAARSQLVVLSFKMGSGVANTRKRLGLFDSADGLYLEQNGTTMNICLRNSITGSTTTVPSSSWEADAQGLDFSKTQILVMDYQWLGVGTIRIGFYVGGEFLLAYTIHNANINTSLYMSSGSLPVRYEITNTAASAGSSFEFYCGSVISEGGVGDVGVFGSTFAAATAAAGKSVTTTEIPLIAIRPKSTFGGVTNNARIIPNLINTFGETRDTQYALYYNPTLTAASWTSASADSAVEYDVSATAFSGGRMIAVFMNDSTTPLLYAIPQLELLALDISGNQPIFLMTAVSYAATTSVHGSITWKEIYR